MNHRRSGTFEGAVRHLLTSTPPADLRAAEQVLTQLGAELRAVGDRATP
jgi:hypothetical protein